MQIELPEQCQQLINDEALNETSVADLSVSLLTQNVVVTTIQESEDILSRPGPSGTNKRSRATIENTDKENSSLSANMVSLHERRSEKQNQTKRVRKSTSFMSELLIQNKEHHEQYRKMQQEDIELKRKSVQALENFAASFNSYIEYLKE